jgi:hypothetical protein
MQYIITKSEVGYIVSSYSPSGAYPLQWAFSTLKEVQDYLPELFNDQ